MRLAYRYPFLAAGLVAIIAAGGCARQISPDVYQGRTIGDTQRTYAGVVQTVRQVEVQESDTLEGNGVGQVLGGLAGGVAAARFGDGVGRALAVAAGAIVGSFAGALAEQEIKRQPGYEYVVRTDRGDLLTVVQGGAPLGVGQRVYVQESGRGRSRVVPAA